MRKGWLRFLGGFLLVLVGFSQAAFSQEFKKIKKSGSLTIKNCDLLEETNVIKLVNKGNAISLPKLKNREDYSLGKKYKFFACTGGLLYAKKKATDTAVTFDLSLTNFPKLENTVSKACKTVKSWPGSHIYKTIGSHHFTDIRRNTVGLILKIGASGPFPSCVDAIDTKGTSVAKLGLYARGAGWAARYYAGVNCGSGTAFNGSAIASRAKKNTGSSKIYMDFGSVCYGPIEANQCIGSSQC